MSSPDVASALARAARTINRPRTLEETLETIVAATRTSIPGFDHAGISVTHRNGTIETSAATGPLVWELDQIQYELDEGPCMEAMREGPIVTAPDLRHDQRWPKYVPAALERGVKAQLAVQLYVDEQTLGGLNLYSTESEIIDDQAPMVAELFATHAALALGRARRESQLSEAIETRQTVGIAIGLTMGRYRIDQTRAFEFLARASSTSNIKVRDLAQEIIGKAEDSYAQAKKPKS
jgi:GAF domain-containing protein